MKHYRNNLIINSINNLSNFHIFIMKKGRMSKFGVGLLAGALSFLPMKSEASDFYNVDIDAWINGQNEGGADFYGRHNTFVYNGETNYLDGIDSYDNITSFDQNPDGSPYIVAYTEVEGNFLDKDYRSDDSLTDYDINTRYISGQGDFTGDADINFSFKHYENGVEYIDPKMFYTGEAIAEPQFTTNNVRQYQKLALLANRDANGDVQFNKLEGLVASDGDDFLQFNIHREPNKILFRQPENGTISVVDSGETAITNGQWLTYEDAMNISVDADTNYDLYRLAIESTDKFTGNRTTNDFLLPPGTRNFTTNLNAVGQTQLQATFEPIYTTNGIPYIWLDKYGITNFNDSVETQDLDEDGHNNLEEYIADTNPTNPASIFYASMTPDTLSLYNTSTSRTYFVSHTTNLLNITWDNYTNNIQGTGSNLILETTSPGFYKGTVSTP